MNMVTCTECSAEISTRASDCPKCGAPVKQNSRELKLGAVLAVAGGLGYFVTLLFHGDLPDQTTEIALEHIAGRPEWRWLKLFLIVSVLCWTGAFSALARSFSGGISSLLGRWAVSVATIGVAIVAVEYAIIGHALKDVADAWMVLPMAEAEALLHKAEIMLAVSGGLFHSFIAWMIGLPFLLLGAAIALGSRYPRWPGWIAIIAGAGALMAGTTRFLGIELVPYPLLYGGFVIPLCFWLAGMGILMWRRE